ncbi:hypothetical protein P280DRAFT_478002 [Massarina eburnea CBS 473.64]|uniref:Uncharacterized protein n=1 Tax=Massarina eburnea CBS 473.64 TaxID=1395130 RepID=A0A6A6S7I8_9PLEO|nr:hypothetical protein P280DRAFT_478002 [Massarina eburnea CBS 473.64]
MPPEYVIISNNLTSEFIVQQDELAQQSRNHEYERQQLLKTIDHIQQEQINAGSMIDALSRLLYAKEYECDELTEQITSLDSRTRSLSAENDELKGKLNDLVQRVFELENERLIARRVSAWEWVCGSVR